MNPSNAVILQHAFGNYANEIYLRPGSITKLRSERRRPSMSQPTLPHLPTELIELIIDEAFTMAFPTGSLSTNSDNHTMSAVALVSHLFRHSVNRRRFAHIDLQRQSLPVTHSHGFRSILLSSAWSSPTSILPYIRGLSVSLGTRCKGMALVPHPVALDGSLADIIRQITKYRNETATAQMFKLTITTHVSIRCSQLGRVGERFDWKCLPEDLVNVVIDLCNSPHIFLCLEWLKNVPACLLSAPGVSSLELRQIDVAGRQEKDSTSVQSCLPSLRRLSLMKSPSFSDHFTSFESTTSLSYHIRGAEDIERLLQLTILLKHHLENLTLHMDIHDLHLVPYRFISPSHFHCLDSLSVVLTVPFSGALQTIAPGDILELLIEPPYWSLRFHLVFQDPRRYNTHEANTLTANVLKTIIPSMVDPYRIYHIRKSYLSAFVVELKTFIIGDHRCITTAFVSA